MMATVIYRAPEGDSELCKMFGVRFLSDEPVTHDFTDREMAKLRGNPYFEIVEEDGVIEPVKKRGRPAKAREPITIDHDEEAGE